MNATRSHATSLKTPVFVLGPGLMSRLVNQGLKNVREFTKGNALEKLTLALRESPKTVTVIILPREAFEKNDLFRHTLTQIKEEFPLSITLALRFGGMANEAMIDNDKKAGAQDVLWHSGQVPSGADCARIVTFVVQGNLPQPQPAPVQDPPATPPTKPATTSPYPITPELIPGKTPSTQELLQRVLAGQTILQAQNEAILRRLDQIHGIASGEALAKMKELYPEILRVLAYDTER